VTQILHTRNVALSPHAPVVIRAARTILAHLRYQEIAFSEGLCCTISSGDLQGSEQLQSIIGFKGDLVTGSDAVVQALAKYDLLDLVFRVSDTEILRPTRADLRRILGPPDDEDVEDDLASVARDRLIEIADQTLRNESFAHVLLRKDGSPSCKTAVLADYRERFTLTKGFSMLPSSYFPAVFRIMEAHFTNAPSVSLRHFYF